MLKKYIFVLMGVSGSGKTSLGKVIAKKLKIKFIDGDDLHPKNNILKMANNIALTDQDRMPWLERITDLIFSLNYKNESGVIVCSALKRKYRDQIRQSQANVKFLFLQGDFEIILNRIQNRKNHFMKSEMLESQFKALEIPCKDENDVIIIDITLPFKEVLNNCLKAIKYID